MTAAVLALPATLCSICGDGADEVSPSPAYFAHGDFWGCEPICVDCAAFAVWDGIEDFAAFRWWTPAAAQRFASQVKSTAEADARDAEALLMTAEAKRPDCVFVGEAGGVSVQVQSAVACLSTSTHNGEGRHVSVMTFVKIDDAAKLSALLARVAEVHAANFTNETAGPRTPAPDTDRMPGQVLGSGQGDTSPRAASNNEARELCPCGEVRDDFGACWKCDAVRT